MSELKVDKVSPRTGNYVALNTVGSKNIVINGDMSIAQRGTSVTGIGNGDSQYLIDRFRFGEGGTPTFEFTMSQDTDVPTGQGFAKSLKLDCTTADTSLAAGDQFRIEYKMEGQHLQYLKKGTSNAESLTLSFWVKSNKTGTYTAELFDFDNTRNISKEYTINTADTWEKKTITYAGDTTGTLNNDNGESLRLTFYLGAGTDFTSGTLATSWESYVVANRISSSQVNLADNTANEFYITGVQLEAGTTASDFEFLPYDMNLQRCYRYYEVIAEGDDLALSNGSAYNATQVYSVVTYTEKRATPSLDHTTGSGYYRYVGNNTSGSVTEFFASKLSTKKLRMTNSGGSVTQGYSYWYETDDASAFFAIDAEL